MDSLIVCQAFWCWIWYCAHRNGCVFKTRFMPNLHTVDATAHMENFPLKFQRRQRRLWVSKWDKQTTFNVEYDQSQIHSTNIVDSHKEIFCFLVNIFHFYWNDFNKNLLNHLRFYAYEIRKKKQNFTQPNIDLNALPNILRQIVMKIYPLWFIFVQQTNKIEWTRIRKFSLLTWILLYIVFHRIKKNILFNSI